MIHFPRLSASLPDLSAYFSTKNWTAPLEGYKRSFKQWTSHFPTTSFSSSLDRRTILLIGGAAILLITILLYRKGIFFSKKESFKLPIHDTKPSAPAQVDLGVYLSQDLFINFIDRQKWPVLSADKMATSLLPDDYGTISISLKDMTAPIMKGKNSKGRRFVAFSVIRTRTTTEYLSGKDKSTTTRPKTFSVPMVFTFSETYANPNTGIWQVSITQDEADRFCLPDTELSADRQQSYSLVAPNEMQSTYPFSKKLQTIFSTLVCGGSFNREGWTIQLSQKPPQVVT